MSLETRMYPPLSFHEGTANSTSPSVVDSQVSKGLRMPPQPGPSARKPIRYPSSVEGRFVSLTGNQLALSTADGRMSLFTLSPALPVTCDGHERAAGDLKAGEPLRVTTTENQRDVATAIEILDGDAGDPGVFTDDGNPHSPQPTNSK